LAVGVLLHGTVTIGKAVPMEPGEDQSVVTAFRSRLRDDAEANGYGELAARLEARARQMPGFVDFKTFVADDGERVSLVTFDSVAHHEAWRDDPEHRAAQEQGRRAFYLTSSVTVCRVLRRRHFDARDRFPSQGEP
jgi:heme-degrading monooxygenase HmoA